MTSLTARALVTIVAILGAINADAGVTSDGATDQAMSINVTPSCIVVGAPVDTVIVNTDLDMDLVPEGAFFVLLINNDVDKKIDFLSTEADAKGELVVKFPFSGVSAEVVGTDDAWVWFYIMYDVDDPKIHLSAYDYIKVHDYQTAE